RKLDPFPAEDLVDTAMARARCRRAKRAGEGERWKQIGLGHPDLLALRRRAEFDAANVRPPADQIGGNADGYIPRWDRYDPPARQQCIQRIRGHAEQNAERTLSLLQLCRQLGDGRFSLCQDILCLVHIEPCCGTALETGLRDLQGLLLFDNVVLRDIHLRLQGTDAYVGGRDIAQQLHQHVIIGCNRREVGRIGGCDAAAEFAPKIQFPGELGPKRRPPEISESHGRIRTQIGSARLVIADVRADLLLLRIEFAYGYSQFGPRFEHAGAGSHECQILLAADIDQAVERRIPEDRPPSLVLLMVGTHGRVSRLQPFCGNRRIGFGEVGTDLARSQREHQGHDEQRGTGRAQPGALPDMHTALYAGASRDKILTLPRMASPPSPHDCSLCAPYPASFTILSGWYSPRTRPRVGYRTADMPYRFDEHNGWWQVNRCSHIAFGFVADGNTAQPIAEFKQS